jgi:hypothetical protein
MALENPRVARVLLGVALAASGILLIVWQSRLTFLIDDWDLLLHRRGISADAFLDPHARHLIVGPAVIYKAIQATFGMDGRLPYAVAAIATFLSSIVLLFAYARRRVGDWLALAAVLPILFMGTAYEDLLSSFQICYFGSIAFGIGALLAIERRDPRGDAFACLLLVLSLAFAEIAIAFAAGVAVAIALQRGPLRRVWVVAVPGVLYIVWYLVWGHSGPHLGPNALSFHNVANSPTYILDGFASSIGSLLGLGTPALFGGTGGLAWGRPLLVAAVAIAVWALRSRSPLRGWLLVALAIGVSFWFLTGANAALGRQPFASRYQYVGAVFVVMIAAECASGWRPGWRALAAVFAVSIAATIGNISTLHQGYRSLAGLSAVVRGGLAGLEIGADHVDPGLVLTPENSDFNYFAWVTAGPYLSAADKFGSPAYTQAELATAPEPAQIAADKVLAAALRIGVRPATGPPRGSCRSVRAAGGLFPVVSLPPGGATLTTSKGAHAALALRRFASDSFPIDAGTVNGTARLEIPADRSSRPWELQVVSAQPVTVCPA